MALENVASRTCIHGLDIDWNCIVFIEIGSDRIASWRKGLAETHPSWPWMVSLK